jgi:hypothetical protein
MIGAFDTARALRGGLDDRRQAWEFIRGFAAEWSSPLAPSDGVSAAMLRTAEKRIGTGLPAALREAYLLFGQRCDLTAVQDRLVPPGDLDFDETESAVNMQTGLVCSPSTPRAGSRCGVGQRACQRQSASKVRPALREGAWAER